MTTNLNIQPEFYTYTYFYNDVPIYVGKGKENRYRDHFNNKTRLGNFLCKRLREGLRLVPDITYFENEKEALDYEIELISFYGRDDTGTGTLFNLTEGGEGISGLIHTEETRQKIRDAILGKTLSVETKRKMSEAKLGKPKSTCPHCGKEGGSIIMKRWHFDNCKHRIVQ